MKHKTLLVILMFISINFLFSSNIVTLKELLKPTAISVDENKIYISEGTSVYIYSKKSFVLLNKFGSKGEGPEDFKGYVGRIFVHGDKLIINSFERISIYSKDGEFIRSENTGRGMPKLNIFPLKTKYLGISLSYIGTDSFFTINIFDKEFNTQKTLLKIPQSKKGRFHIFSSFLAVNRFSFMIIRSIF